MTNRDYLIRIFVIILAFTFPFICLSYGETRESISSYFNSSLQPIYIISNTLTAYLLYSLDKWKCPAIFLLFLVAFPLEGYKIVHNIFAYGFFFSCFAPIFKHNRLKLYSIPYLLSLIFLMDSFLWTEIVCILTLCIFHGHLLYLKYSVDTKRKVQSNEVIN